jgi:AcrR family transcriptional regulator
MGGGWRHPTPAQPSPPVTQRRAVETIRAAIDATVELLERLPEHQVTLEAIRERSGVSQGSLSHHFGSREGLIATAHVERYARSCAADEAFFRRLGTPTSLEMFSAVFLSHIEEMLTPERRMVRWLRMSAIAAALGDERLTATLSDRYTSLIDRLDGYVETGRALGVIREDADVRTLALLVSMQAQGLVLDDIVEQDVSTAAWNHLMVRFVSCFLTPAAGDETARQEQARFGDLWRAEVFGGPGKVPTEVVDRLDAVRQRAASLRRSDGPGAGSVPIDIAGAMMDPLAVRELLDVAEQGTILPRGRRSTSATNEQREQIMRATIRSLREQGARGIDLAEIRTATGVSTQAFHRLVGTRESLVREARLRLEISRSAWAIARFAGIVAGSTTPADMRAGLEAGAIRMADDVSRAAMWQRIETLSATRTDPELRTSLARVQRTTRDLLIEQVCLAQSRGFIDADLPCRGVARFLDGTVFWHVFHGLDAHRPPRSAWTAMLADIARFLSPDAIEDRSIRALETVSGSRGGTAAAPRRRSPRRA